MRKYIGFNLHYWPFYITKSYIKNVLKTVWYKKICYKHYRKHKDHHMGNVEVDGGEVGDDEVGKKGRYLSKSKKTESDFFTSKARMAFTKLRQEFIKAPIFHHFDPERHIWVETDALSYAISRVLSQLTSNNSGQWHSIAFFSRKMIPAETRYETHDGELLAIVEAFKTWRHYLKGSQHEVLILTNYNNLRRFMETKSLRSRQVRWAKELSCYHFQINYR